MSVIQRSTPYPVASGSDRRFGGGQGIEGRLSAKVKIAQKAVDLLAQEPEGLRYAVLLGRLKAELPEAKVHTIEGSLVGLAEYRKQDIYKPARGLFQHVMYRESENPVASEAVAPASPAKEEDFYASFAEYLT